MTTIELPGAAADALEMAHRLGDIAERLRDLGIKPASLSVGGGYLYTLDRAEDMVTVHAREPRDFLRIEADWGLTRDEIERDEIGNVIGNAYASGIVGAVAVMVFASAEKVLDAEAVSA